MILIGGTFDPIHNGHLKLASTLLAQFQQPVMFVPNNLPSYKDAPTTTAKQRLDMLYLAIAGASGFLVEEMEVNQSEYYPTIKTLTLIREKLGPTIPLIFCIGSDSLVTLDSWDNWQDLFKLAHFVVATRNGYNLKTMNKNLHQQFNRRITQNKIDLEQPAGKIFMLDFEPIDISSTQIRNLVQDKQPIDQFVPIKVAKYINHNLLYQ